MDKNAIKKYAVWAREQLIEKVTARAIKYEIVDGKELDDSVETIGGELLSETEIKQRKALIQKIKSDGYSQVMEEVAYTWFNRFVAIRFMEVNGYLPSHVRVFSDENGSFKPQILIEAIHLDLAGLDVNIVMQYKEDANEEELFKYLLKIQCNALNEILPQMFQKIDDYSELLLPDYLLRAGSVIEKLVNEIPEDNFDVNTENGQIEVIGWMYQYYISAKHEEVVDPLHGKVVKKEEVPAATQLFTTDWVVRYLIDNSVGRYWIERNPESKLADELTYFVKPKDGKIKTVNEKITPQDVTVFDPCVGSGHFLVYAFEVLMKIYVEYGFSERDAASEIVKNNLFGLDIDGRATQLAYFAVMMKARQYDRRFLTKGILPNIYEIRESNTVDKSSIEYFYGNDATLKKDIDGILDTLKDAKEYGSILQMPVVDFGKINERFERFSDEISMYSTYLLGDFQELIRPAEIMGRKYAVVATNPPYLNKYDEKLKGFIFDRYKDYSGDLFSVFIFRNFGFCKRGGYSGFMTPFVWMFIKTYERLRSYIVSEKAVVSVIQMEYSAFEEATVPICSFVLKNEIHNELSMCFKLSEFKGGMEVQRKKIVEAIKNPNCGYYYEANQSNFFKIPSCPIAYWVSDKVLSCYSQKNIYDYANPCKGIDTGDNNIFLRFWHEVSNNDLFIPNGDELTDQDFTRKKWFPYNKGGNYRKWYGNNEYVLNWENNGFTLRNYKKSNLRNKERYFCEGITWSTVTFGNSSFRYFTFGFLFDNGGSCLFANEKLYYIQGMLNSCVTKELLSIQPTINNQPGTIGSLPLIVSDNESHVNSLVSQNIDLAKIDWDCDEVSWDFQSHPLVPMSYEHREQMTAGMNSEERKKAITLLSERYKRWEQECEYRFSELKKNEEELNRIFIDIYGLQDELTPDVEDKDVSVRKADLQKDIRSLISYAVGCMFGRYSIYVPGIIYAGGEWPPYEKAIGIREKFFPNADPNVTSWQDVYGEFGVDTDAIIPICDDEYFSDDIVGRFIEFIEVVYGKDTLEENLQFIADALGGSGSAREIIRNYFINDFYADHLKTYQKRPIYWLFDSGKKNGFKCLVYMHRYKPDTIARIRTDYVHEQQARYRTAIEEIEKRIDTVSASEKVKLTKKLNTLKAQDEELHGYEEKIHHLADQMISIDLDDGVKVNYAKFQDVLAKIK